MTLNPRQRGDHWALAAYPEYLDAWLELKALNQNIQHSNWDVFIINQANEQQKYQTQFFQYNNDILAQ